MKKGVLILTLIGLFLTLSGCSVFQSNSIAGTYYGEHSPEVYIKINSNGTFSTLMNITGTYEVSGNELTFFSSLGAYTYQIDGNRLSPVDGSNILFGSQVYVKK